jgi:hypothetical protein
MTMIHNFEVVMRDQKSSLNSIIRLCRKVIASPTLNYKLLEYMKLEKIAIVWMFGFVEIEHTFNTFIFMKN